MTTKTTEKAPSQESSRPTQESSRPTQEPGASRSPEETRITFQCHTLAQILLHHVAATHPWLLHVPQAPHPHNRPMVGLDTTSWNRAWPGAR